MGTLLELVRSLHVSRIAWLVLTEVVRTTRDMHGSQIRRPSAFITAVEMWKVDVLCPGANGVEILLCPPYPRL